MTLETELRDLVMIGSTPAGGRLMHHNGRVLVDQNMPYQCIVRRWNGEGRDRTISSIREVILSAEERVGDMCAVSDVSQNPDFSYRVEALHRAMLQSIEGMHNLKATYVSDASARASLDLVISKTQTLINRLASILSADNDNLQKYAGC